MCRPRKNLCIDGAPVRAVARGVRIRRRRALRSIMSIHKSIAAPFAIAALAIAGAIGAATAPTPAAAADAVEPGRFVWRDLMTKDVEAAKKFYGELFGWRFENARRGDRPYVHRALGQRSRSRASSTSAGCRRPARSGSATCRSPTWTRASRSCRPKRGKVLVEPRELPIARVAVVTDPEGAPLGLAQLRRSVPDPSQPSPHHFFWQEYLARDAEQALAFYKRLAGYESEMLETRLDVDYHVLRSTRGRAGLFRLPPPSPACSPTGCPTCSSAIRRRSPRACLARRPCRRPGRARAAERLARGHRRSRRRGAGAAEVSVLRLDHHEGSRLRLARRDRHAADVRRLARVASCDNVSGVGVGMGTSARWGGSSSSPPVFVGGPSNSVAGTGFGASARTQGASRLARP